MFSPLFAASSKILSISFPLKTWCFVRRLAAGDNSKADARKSSWMVNIWPVLLPLTWDRLHFRLWHRKGTLKALFRKENGQNK